MNPEFISFLDQIESIKTGLEAKGSTAWFRGLSQSAYNLSTTLQREVNKLTEGILVSDEEKGSLLRQYGKSIYWKFQSYARSLLNSQENTKYGILFRMRHHGIPCNIMDWTESLTCALYFAHRAWKPGQEAAIYILDPQALNGLALDRTEIACIDDEGLGNFPSHLWHPVSIENMNLRTVAVLPYHSNPRTIAQRAMFTLNGSSLLPLEDQFDGKLVKENVLMKFLLPSSICESVRRYLSLSGVDDFIYFPDFEGLSHKILLDLENEREATRKHFPHLFSKGNTDADSGNNA